MTEVKKIEIIVKVGDEHRVITPLIPEETCEHICERVLDCLLYLKYGDDE